MKRDKKSFCCEHGSILPYISRRRLWEEGCTDKDEKLGLIIKYLNIGVRKQRFEDAKKAMPMEKLICYLQPSLEQFAKRFGTANLGFDASQYLSNFVDKSKHGSIPKTKKRCCKLDSFLTLEEACRHYFDCRTLEEAIWDLIGIPRITVLDYVHKWYWCSENAGTHEEKLKKAG